MVGQTLGHYRIVERVGQGGMGDAVVRSSSWLLEGLA